MQTVKRDDLLPLIANLSAETFHTTALQVFRYQAAENPLYARFLSLLKRHPASISRLEDIPFLPVSFFKTHDIRCGNWTPEAFFTSSGTTGQQPARHALRDQTFYLENTVRGFTQFYGDPSDYCVLALLPSYLERTGSSLVAMAEHFIQRSKYAESGFFLHDTRRLAAVLRQGVASGFPILLLGVSFALLDFAEIFPIPLGQTIVMETGGMKGRRREMTRTELHAVLQAAFGVEHIHSEYGMTELFSQAYSMGDERFSPSNTLKVVATEVNDPFCPVAPGRTGVLNMIDLANLDTCAFIATEDVGKVYADGRFEVLGRLDIAEMRGCNLLLEQ